MPSKPRTRRAARFRVRPPRLPRDAEPRLRALRQSLESHYGPHPWRERSSEGGGGGTLGVLIEALLSQNTNMTNARRGYAILRRELPTWPKVLSAPREAVERHIAICGLALQRSRRLQDLLRRIKSETGRLSLDHLRNFPPDEALAYLLSFEGIGPKTAAFTLMFAFDHPVLPVEGGLLRVLKRLKLVPGKTHDHQAQSLLSPALEKGAHHPVHVLLFRHAKLHCKPKNPRCHDCPLLKSCPFGQRHLKHHPPEDLDLTTLPPPKVRRKILARMISSGILKSSSKSTEAA